MSASFGPGDADEELTPRLVRELVLPLAQHALQDVWNPANRRQSRAAAAMVADLLVYVPPDDSKMQASSRRSVAFILLKHNRPNLCRSMCGPPQHVTNRSSVCFSHRMPGQPKSCDLLGSLSEFWGDPYCH